MPNGILGGQGGTLLSAIVIVAVALLALFAVVWLYRRRSPSTFVRGGRARLPRLAVLDAAAVDTRRRIVLIRRDDVEHLVMIGGPTDVVIESRIVTHDEAAEAPGPAPQNQARRETASQTSPATDPAPSEPVPQDRIPRDMAQTTAHEPSREAARPQPVPPVPTTATPPPAPRTAAPATAVHQPRAARATAAEPIAAASVAPITAAAGAAAAAGGASPTLEDEAADILDSARARVFQDQTAATAVKFSEGTAQGGRSEPGGDSHPQIGRDAVEAPPVPQPTPPLGYGEVMSDAEPAGEPGHDLDASARREPVADTPVAQPAPVEAKLNTPAEPSIPNFEEVLAAELSGDLALEDLDDPQPEVSEADPDTRPDPTIGAEPSIVPPAGAPEVQPDTPPSRDSLEDEMARLLGDLTRKS